MIDLDAHMQYRPLRAGKTMTLLQLSLLASHYWMPRLLGADIERTVRLHEFPTAIQRAPVPLPPRVNEFMALEPTWLKLRDRGRVTQARSALTYSPFTIDAPPRAIAKSVCAELALAMHVIEHRPRT